MPSSDTRQLQLQISASAELMIRNLKIADNAVAAFQQSTNSRLTSIDAKFAAVGNLRSKLGGLDRGVGLGDIVSAATGVTLVALAKRGLEYASSLQEVSQQLGVTSRDLQTFRYAASQVGIEQETMERGLAKLTVTMGKARLGAEGPTKAFSALGISIADLKNKDAGQVIPLIADGLARIPDPARRAALEVELFGKAGQKLDTLLASGRGQVDQLADAAQRLGLVLSDDQIARADETADKLSEVKQVLEANVAGVVADNAHAIVGLASALGSLTSEVVKFLSSNPQAAIGILGALAGGRVGGLPGAAAGAIVGSAIGNRVQERQLDASSDIPTRQRELAKAMREYAERLRFSAGSQTKGAITNPGILSGLIQVRRGNASLASGDGVQGAKAEVNRQRTLLAQARIASARTRIAKATTQKVVDVDVPEILATGGGGSKKGKTGKSAEQLKREADAAAHRDRREQARANDLLDRGNADVLSGRADLSGDPEERLTIELQRVELARKARDRDLEEDALDNRYIAANLDKLKAINAEVAQIDKAILLRRRAQEADQLAFDSRRAAQDDAIAVLEIQSRLALIAKDRNAIEQRILELKQEEERLALQRIIDDKNGRFTPGEKRLAAEAAARLPERQAAERDSQKRDQSGPLARYRDQLISATGDMNEALEGVAVNGLQSLEDGILGVISGTESLGSAFKKMASSIIADLARIAIEKAIVGALGKGFLGFADGGEVKGFAGGGPIYGAGGPRSDSIPAMLSNGEYVINAVSTARHRPLLDAINDNRIPRFAAGGLVASSVPSFAGSGSGGASRDVRVTVYVEEGEGLRGSIRAVATEASVQVVRGAAPAIADMATAQTLEAYRRPGM